MEKFRKQVKKTLIIYIAVLIAAIVLLVVLKIVKPAESENISSDFGTGACAGVISLMAMNIARYSVTLKSDEELKKLYIASTDERSRLIYEKSSSSSFRTTLIVLGLSTMVASFYSETVFYTLLAVIFVIIFIQVIFNFYYRRKY